MTVIDINSIVDKINQIPPMPATATRLISTVSRQEHSLEEVRRIVENDSNITAYVLKVANSAFAAQREPVSSVKNAIMILGENMVVSAALQVCASGLFGKVLDGYEAGKKAMWRHSISTAIAAKHISKYLKNQKYSEVVYTAGIMHDIGKVIISDFLVGRTCEIMDVLENGGHGDFLSGERDLLGTDHCEIGALLGEKWNFPESITSAIRFHHHPSEAPEEWKPLVHVVQLADAAAMMSGSATGSDCLQYEIDNEYMDYLEFSCRDMEKIMITMELEVEKLMGIMFGDSERNNDEEDNSR